MNFGARAEHGCGGMGIAWDNAAAVDRFVGRMSEGTRLVVSIEREVPRRTPAQNRLMWRNYEVALRRMSALSGHTKEELHDAMKRRFLEPTRIYSPSGELVGETYSTKNLTTVEESEFIDRVLALFAGYGEDLMA